MPSRKQARKIVSRNSKKSQARDIEESRNLFKPPAKSLMLEVENIADVSPRGDMEYDAARYINAGVIGLKMLHEMASEGSSEALEVLRENAERIIQEAGLCRCFSPSRSATGS